MAGVSCCRSFTLSFLFMYIKSVGITLTSDGRAAMAGRQVFLLCAAIFTLVSGSHMQGGTISFKAAEETQAGWLVDFTYKSSFIDNYGDYFHWGCLAGDCGSEINRWLEPVENRTLSPSRWYQYEGHIRRRVDNDKPFQLLESSCCWVYNIYYANGWQLTTSVDLGIRSDTRTPNSSPVTTIIPVLRIPRNCGTTITLLGHDPDGDRVACRYGYYYGECSSCSWSFYVDESRCTLSVPSSVSSGSYVVELILEDFPKNNIDLTYKDGTMVYKYPNFSRKSRELPEDSQKYYWYWDSTSASDAASYADSSWTTESVTDIGTSYGVTWETSTEITSTTEHYTSHHPSTAAPTYEYSTIQALTDTVAATTADSTAQTMVETTAESTVQTMSETTAEGESTAQTMVETTAVSTVQPVVETTAESTVQTMSETTAEAESTVQTMTETTAWARSMVQTMAETMAESTTQTVAETTTQTVAETTAQTVAETTTWARSTVQTMAETMAESTIQTMAESTTQTVAETTTQTVAETTTSARSTVQTMAETMAETTTQTVAETTTQTVAETTAQTVAETTTQTVAETTTWARSTVQTMAETMAESTTQTMAETMAESTTQTMAESTTQTMAETTAQTVAETTAQTEAETTTWARSTVQTMAETMAESTIQTADETTAGARTMAQTEAETTTQTMAETMAQTEAETMAGARSTVQPGTSSVTEAVTETVTETLASPYFTTDVYYPSSQPPSLNSLSKISLQFLVEVTSSAPSCTLGDYRPKFVSPTPNHGEKLLTNVGSAVQLHLSAQAAYESISDFLVSGPPGITKSFTGSSRSTTRSVLAEWTPSEHHVGDHIPFCFVAETSGGYQSEMRCVVAVVGPSHLDNIELTCHENTMTLILGKSSDHELYENQFRLNNPQCLVSSNSTHLIASVAYNSCGTETEETEDDIVFKNQATSFSDKVSVITREHGVSIPFNCSFPKKSRVSASFLAHKSDYVFTEAGFGKFTYNFQFFSDDRFVEVETQYPLEATLRQLLYMEIQVSSSVPNVQLFVESCKATPHDNPSDPTFYDLIQNGCIKDETLVVYSANRTGYRFAVEAFAFIGDYSEVYMSCTVILCKLGESGTRCSQGCIPKSQGGANRRRRSVSSESQQHFISQGPLRMKRQSPSDGDLEAPASLDVNTLVVSVSGAAVVASLGFIVYVYTKRGRRSGYNLLKTQDF